jgi:uncharacterized protein
MIGMDRTTGSEVSGAAHLAQSIADILSTPLGSRVQRRPYGSRLPDLIDAPANKATRVQLFAATATALMRWEPRLILSRVGFRAVNAKQGQFEVDINGRIKDTGNPVSLTVPLQLGTASA